MNPKRAKAIKGNIGTASKMPQTVKSIIFGDSGSGKTTLIATAPKPMLVINVDDSIVSLPPDDEIYIYPNPEQGRPVETWKEFTTVAIDSITEAGHLLKEKMLGEEGPTNRFHDRMFSQSDYGLFMELMLDEIRRIRNFQSNVVMTAQCRDDDVEKPEGGKERWRMPDLGAGKQSGPKTIPHMDLVGYLEVHQHEEHGLQRRLLTQPIKNRQSKIRTRNNVNTPTGFVNPDLTTIFNLIYKEDE